MEKIQMCRICLVENVRMFVVGNKDLQGTYEKLTNTPFVTEDSRPMLACVFCYTRLKQCCQLQRKCLEAETLLNQMLNGVFRITPLKIKQEADCFGGYIRTAVQHVIIDRSVSVDGDIKEEPATDCHRTDDVISYQFKVEQNEDLEQENTDNGFHEDDVPTNLVESDSEDDVPLVKFKFEVEEEPLGMQKKKKVVKNETRKPDCSEIILSKEEQLDSLLARSKSSNYLHSPFKCNSCYKGFVDTTAYENHKMKHDLSSGPHVCDICHMRYRSVQLMRTHASTAHARIFKCNKCGHVSHTSNQARIHEKWHDGHTYECQLCSHTFRKPTSYLSHMRKRHPTEHVCNICGETFVGKHGLQMHKRKTHINGEKMVDPADPADPASKRFCVECNIQFYNSEAWERHILRSVKHTLKTEESKSCSICQWKYAGHETLETHMKEHAKALRRRKPPSTAKERSFRCNQCGSNFMSRSKLQAHTNRTHLGLKYNKNIVCEVCGKKCSTSQHVNERDCTSYRRACMTRCMNVDEVEGSNATLKYHQRTHTGEKPYPCLSCSKHFVDSNQLRIHVRTHTGEKPYVCAACGKRFTQKPALNRHYRVHTGAKPYTCQYCSRTFSQSNSLKLHVKTVHLKQPANRKNKTKIVSQETKVEKNCEEDIGSSLEIVRV